MSAVVIVSSISSGGNSVFEVGTVIVLVVRLLAVIVLEVLTVGVVVVSSSLCTL